MANYEMLFEASYDRVIGKGVGITAKGERFFERFYDNFLGLSDEVRGKFSETDMKRQIGMLQRSIYHLVNFYITKEAGDYLRSIAYSHSRADHDVKPELYDLWLDAVIQTVRELDPEFDDQVELAWRIVMMPGILYMQFHCDKPVAVSAPDATDFNDENS